MDRAAGRLSHHPKFCIRPCSAGENSWLPGFTAPASHGILPADQNFLGGVMGVQYKWIGMGLLLALAAGNAAAADANPEDGKITDGSYNDPYFGLNFPLPEGYGPGLDPAPPSITGYYVSN